MFVLRGYFREHQTRYDSNFCHVVSGHIDVHSNIKWFDSISFAETSLFDKTLNYNLGVFSKNEVFTKKIKIVHTLPEYTSICHVVTQ